MPEFPVELLEATSAQISGTPGGHSIRLDLEPFLLDGEIGESSFRFDRIVGLPEALSDCVGQKFEFATNREDGCIDGSIYIAHAHHQADLTRLSFEQRGKQIVAQFDVAVRLSIEGLQDADGEDYDDFTITLSAPIGE